MAARDLAELVQAFSTKELEANSGMGLLRAKLKASLFDRQLAFIDDTQHPKRIACCGRRAGKTQAIIRGMFDACLAKPRSVVVYFGASFKSANRNVWTTPDGIPTLIGDMAMTELCTVNESEHRVTFKNGSVLWVAGCETLPDARVWKGLRYDLAVLDEAQDWPDEILAYMVNQALSPALMDRRGQLILTGTPAPYFAGLFYEAANGIRQGWGIHHWTCFENPHIADPESYIRTECVERALSIDDPIVQREFYGRWVRDSNTLLFHYQPGRNDYETLPQEAAWRYSLGMDIGVRDMTTYNLAAYRPYDKTVYFLHSYGERATEETAPVTRFAEVVKSYQTKLGKGLRLVADLGALALSYQLELRNRFGINLEPAKKSEKAGAIRLMNDQFRLGNVKLGQECGPLKKQLMTLQVDPKTQIEKMGMACDFADGALYAFRDCWAFLAGPAEDPSPSAEQQRMVQRIIAGKLRSVDPFADQEARSMTMGRFDEQL